MYFDSVACVRVVRVQKCDEIFFERLELFLKEEHERLRRKIDSLRRINIARLILFIIRYSNFIVSLLKSSYIFINCFLQEIFHRERFTFEYARATNYKINVRHL